MEAGAEDERGTKIAKKNIRQVTCSSESGFQTICPDKAGIESHYNNN